MPNGTTTQYVPVNFQPKIDRPGNLDRPETRHQANTNAVTERSQIAHLSSVTASATAKVKSYPRDCNARIRHIRETAAPPAAHALDVSAITIDHDLAKLRNPLRHGGGDIP